MNYKQRNQNRLNAKFLSDNTNICPECGERGLHWVSYGDSVWIPERGFWICDKFYKNGRRLE